MSRMLWMVRGCCAFFLSFFIINMRCIEPEEKRMVVVIPSYNNEDWYQRNLDSVFNQNYTNYRVVYIDDQSPDGTGDLVDRYLRQRGLKHKCLLIKNEVRYGQLFNRYKAIHACDNDEIVVLLDGDDWFAHDNVLSYLNKIYCQQEVLLTVGNACRSSNGKKISYRDYTENELNQFGVRQLGFRGVHPRTFYAGLFKKIKVQDLMHGGKFLMVATDVAFMLPMFEMARDRYQYIHDILYVYNTENPINLYKFKFERQIYFDLITRNRQPYKKLSEAFSCVKKSKEDYMLSYILFMEEEKRVNDFFQYHCSNGITFDSFVKIGNGDPYKKTRGRSFFHSSYTLDIGYPLDKIYQYRFNFKERLLKTLEKCGGSYLLVSTEKMLKSDINLTQCIRQLEQTGAFGVMFGKSDAQFLKEHSYDVSTWGSQKGIYLFHKWMYQDVFKELSDCCGMLLRRDDFVDLIEQLEIFHPNYYTLLAACNSVVREESVFLVTDTTRKGPDDDQQ